jgi:hypothetical protein
MLLLLLHIQVVPGYMSLIRRHGLLQQQLTALLTQLEVVRMDDDAPISLQEVEQVMVTCYRPLLLYRAVSLGSCLFPGSAGLSDFKR